MTSRDQHRTVLLTKLVAGELTVEEVAIVLGRSTRQVWRLRRRYQEFGVDAIVHGNRGRASARRLPEATRARILELARTTYDGANDSHLSELLAEHEGIVIARSSLRRLLRSAGRPSPRHRRAPRHRSRRDRMPQAGLLVQLDGSRHDWLEERGPRFTLIGGIDDASGIVTAATFRDQEDAAGYLTVLRDTVRRHGVPLAVYRDRHGIFETPERASLSLEEQLVDVRTPTQVGRALAELAITSIAARSPQAKGRIERLWGTFQDRLVTELRLAGATDRGAANAVLGRFVARFNRRFAVAPVNPEPAWRARPGSAELERICCLKYRRVVARDDTVRAGATILQLPARPGGRAYAGRRVELHLRLDGRLIVWDGEREILTTPAPADPVQLRALEAARVEVGTPAPSAGSIASPPPTHPWRTVRRDSKLGQQRLTESLNR